MRQGTTTVVIQKGSDPLQEMNLNLFSSTVEDFIGEPTHFCYYFEANEITTFAGIRGGDTMVFIKLVHGEPEHLTLAEWNQQWDLFPEYIPDDV